MRQKVLFRVLSKLVLDFNRMYQEAKSGKAKGKGELTNQRQDSFITAGLVHNENTASLLPTSVGESTGLVSFNCTSGDISFY